MARKLGTALMLSGTALIVAALSLLLWNCWEDRQAGAAVEDILPQIVEISETNNVRDTKDGGADSSLYSTEMTQVEIDGFWYIGYLSVPILDLELPVMSEWDYDRLKISPCRYSGSTKTGDLVIAAHNYSRHFGIIKTLSVGDKVYFTDMDGTVSAYEVEETDVLSPDAVEEMTAGDFALTLFTCTYGGQSRVTVRCKRVQEP